ncbi:MAG: VCBS repeat-containing protein [Deltaproteobacteria bacterium]|jgi:hypothetical protein|nr:VCBS repeat-containing protein [Deltaproteobacteria bacterium]
MRKTPKILAALAIAALSVMVVATPAFSADENKPTVRHPSYTLLGKNPPPVDSPLNPNFILSQESKISEGSLWHGNYISERLVGLDVADATGDGKNELVYATPHNVYFARMAGDVLEQLATFEIPKSHRALSVDFFDVNNDGRHEIIISCQLAGGGPSAYVLAYSSGQRSLQVLGSHIPWYARVYGDARNKRLAVQKGSAMPKMAYGGDVYQATFVDGTLVSGAKIPLPFGVGVYNFNVGSLGPTQQQIVATVTFPEEHLRLYAGGTRDDFVAQASAEYCGTVNYINLGGAKEEGRDVVYIPSRIVFADIDNDGANEVIVAKNRQSGVAFMRNLRAFDGGVIEAMKFNNLSLLAFFSSANLLPGPPVDYVLADLDNNGTKDLVAAVVIEPGSGMMNAGRSVIVSYGNLYSKPATDPNTSTASK